MVNVFQKKYIKTDTEHLCKPEKKIKDHEKPFTYVNTEFMLFFRGRQQGTECETQNRKGGARRNGLPLRQTGDFTGRPVCASSFGAAPGADR